MLVGQTSPPPSYTHSHTTQVTTHTLLTSGHSNVWKKKGLGPPLLHLMSQGIEGTLA